MDRLILLDVDGTLADTHEVWLKKINTDYHQELLDACEYPFTLEDISDWNFGPKSAAIGLDVKACDNITKVVWEESWDQIPLMDPYIPGVVEAILEKYVSVDVVTANDRTDEIEQWLAFQDISYRNFLLGRDDVKLQYQILIEDNPTLADKISDDQTLLLIDQPWNQDVVERENVIRFTYFWELPDLLETILGTANYPCPTP